jgi:hypothetical protein
MNRRAQLVASGIAHGRTLTKAMPGLKVVERMAWRIPLATRTLLVVLGVLMAVALAGGSSLGAWVVTQNNDKIAEARTSGFGLADAATDFRSSLAAADARAASVLLAGREAPFFRPPPVPQTIEYSAAYETFNDEVEEAALALARASTLAGAADQDQIDALTAGLADYVSLVEGGYANARQGNGAVATAYLDAASTKATAMLTDSLVVTADQLRWSGERRVAAAANEVGGPWSVLAMAIAAVAPLVVAGSAMVVAGRARRLVHPGLVVALTCSVAASFLVVATLAAQRHDMEAAATTYAESYQRFDDASVDLSVLRMTEIKAVARHGAGGPGYEEFIHRVNDLLEDLRRDETQGLVPSVEDYRNEVRLVRTTDLERGDNLGAASMVVTGTSRDAFGDADEAVADGVDQARSRLDARLARAAAADEVAVLPGAVAGTGWVAPLVLGLLGTATATSALSTRSRRYNR